MNVANKDLCAELYGLSGWDGTHQSWHTYNAGEHWSISRRIDDSVDPSRHQRVPAYSLGYLLRKLPETIENKEHGFLWRWHLTPLGSGFNFSYQNEAWVASHRGWLKRRHFDDDEIDNLIYWQSPTWKQNAADAVCLIVIELFKQGILTKEKS